MRVCSLARDDDAAPAANFPTVCSVSNSSSISLKPGHSYRITFIPRIILMPLRPLSPSSRQTKIVVVVFRRTSFLPLLRIPACYVRWRSCDRWSVKSLNLLPRAEDHHRGQTSTRSFPEVWSECAGRARPKSTLRMGTWLPATDGGLCFEGESYFELSDGAFAGAVTHNIWWYFSVRERIATKISGAYNDPMSTNPCFISF